ncbi:MAG TPA: RluA family pseudouridine synthase [Chitinophagales bacterium]|nr:RluA family pseudouridine synthase [Chitinophagales bacterium]HQD11659.1 RluA family pseudouridine synthase [Chitinophagales bacterium]HQO31473.1 RluA family pseudouridine synthase [Chitinophagales bacterium]HQO89321.1 RluA family pseudouridine synthase [Chitinophagales bacterium]
MQPLDILYEDNHIIAVNKRSGDIVQGDETGDTPLSDLVKAYIKEKYQKPGEVFLGVVHRIDRPVSGIVLFARTSKSLSRLNELFKTKEITKTYWAVVKKKPVSDSGTLTHYHLKDEKTRKARLFDKEVAHSKKCVLHYRWLASSDHYHLLEIQLETGRFHQIRAQLAKIGSPIKGDVKYGFERPNENTRSIHLHARKISFIHPVKNEPIELTAPVPDEKIWQFFEKEIA